MSLRGVHILFIVAATLLSLSIGAWSFGQYRQLDNGSYLIMTVSALILTALLAVYGVWFVGKIRREGKRD